ncbi:hypothetical protein [Clostridium estertheticum]|uniref:hypothetical protein n=1 Tax=Clostridium estertheticum TaxID=238834 RepID=UPI001C0DDAD3|nr:hypothetical protein [Clostridium estertheticum]MBU3173332.1 hypothetical protein [Clostridium estertheticum]
MKRMNQVGNVSSKYYFAPEKFDEDVAKNNKDYESRKLYIRNSIKKILIEKPDRMEETFSMMIDALKKLKTEFDL